MNNDYLGLHHQVIDLNVISLGDGQRHSIRDFRRDGPTNRPEAGNSNDGTRQDIREHRTAALCSHELSPSFECFFERCRSSNVRQVKSLGSLQRFKLSSTFVSRRIKLALIQNRIAFSINRDMHPGKSGFSYGLDAAALIGCR
jgi:hypothetical protein